MEHKDIKAAPYNPRTITDVEKQGLEVSMNEFGDISGITWNKKTSNLISGHKRWELLQQKGNLTFGELIGERREILIDGEPSGYDLRIVEWEIEKEKAANVAANSHTIAGKFDNDLIATLLEDIEAFNEELSESLNMDMLKHDLRLDDSWDSDIDDVNKSEGNTSGLDALIKVTCKKDDHEELLYYIKDKIMETGFEGVHVV